MQYRFFLCAKTYTWDMSKYTADRIVVDCGYIDTSQAPDTSSGVSMGLKLAFPTLTSVSLIIGFMRLINYCSLSSRFHLPSLPEIKQQQSPDYIGIRIFNSLSFFLQESVWIKLSIVMITGCLFVPPIDNGPIPTVRDIVPSVKVCILLLSVHQYKAV